MMRHDDNRFLDFLTSPAVAADKTKHSGRTLLAHLLGTERLLHDWGKCYCVRTAGLFHSIYGTESFRHQSWPLDDRETIKLLIGDTAETLAYLFCTINRRRTLFAEPPLLNQPWLRWLREIEAANLIEQRSGRGDYLRQLYQSDISDKAKGAIINYINALRRERDNAQVPVRSG